MGKEKALGAPSHRMPPDAIAGVTVRSSTASLPETWPE